jgi:hypothetical protein
LKEVKMLDMKMEEVKIANGRVCEERGNEDAER